MDQLQQEINEKVEETKEDLDLQAGYSLNSKQTKELQTIGRTSIDLLDFAPYIVKASRYLHDEPNAVWSLAINTISGNVEITLKGCQLVL